MSVPLCVDLDGTLIKTDSLFESFLILIKKNPFYIFLTFVWIMKGIASLKQEISKRVLLNPSLFPYTKDFLAFLQEEHRQGRKLFLVTAADKKIAEGVANYLGIFSEVLASDGKKNLKGEQKRQMLCQLTGEKNFDYAGNDKSDLKVWASARNAIVVNASAKLLKRVKDLTTVTQVFNTNKNMLVTFLKAIRCHQYVKNILIFLPLFTSHLYWESSRVLYSSLGFVAFCLLASSVYLTNDLVDIEADRNHRTKHNRAFAAGNLSIQSGIITIVLFTSIAFLLALKLNLDFLLILICYFGISSLYSFFIKQKLLIDVFVLAILYTIRIIAGIAAIQSEYSEWLLTFSIFFFLSLAFVKRYSELYFTKQENKDKLHGRNYQVEDLHQISVFGTVSGYISTLVFAFYINSPQVMKLYHHPQWLWIICFILLYWISRIWMLTVRGKMQEDPILFAIKDKVSVITGFIIVLIMVFATL